MAARLGAALVAVVAWAGLAVQFAAVFGRTGSVAATLWGLVAYFTVLTNLLVAVLCTGLALRGPGFAAPRWSAGATLAIVLVGAVYHLLLRGLLVLSGGDALADRLLHTATPVLTSLYWLAFVRKGALVGTDPLRWALYPLLYFGYALARGAVTGRYAYPFLDVGALGAAATLRNAVAIAAAFLVAGAALVRLDRRLGDRQPARAAL